MILLYQKRKFAKTIIVLLLCLLVDIRPVQCMNVISRKIKMEMHLNQEATMASQVPLVQKKMALMDVKLKGTIFLVEELYLERESLLMMKQ